ncbi:hypothetical protein [Epilithonimonas lactis]|nr:hypothetical protein [Epilithonimonas lactis]
MRTTDNEAELNQLKNILNVDLDVQKPETIKNAVESVEKKSG